MAKIGEIVYAEKLLTARELHLALENHVLHAVKLGTCLVEMGLVSDEDLARCLGKKSGQEFLTKDQLLTAGAQHMGLIPPALIKKQRIVPVGMDGRVMKLAVDQDLSIAKQDDLQRSIGKQIRLLVVSGYAMDMFLETTFGIPRPGRYLPKPERDLRPEVRMNKIEQSAPVNQDPDAPVVVDGVVWRELGDVDHDQVQDDINTPLPISDLAQQLSQAKSRDDVAKSLLGFMSFRSSVAALLLVNERTVRGWRASYQNRVVPLFGEFSEPVSVLQDLKNCVESMRPTAGSALSEATSRLRRYLGSFEGPLAYFPIILRQRVVAVLVTDVSIKLNPDEILEACQKAAYAFEILVLKAKLLNL